MNNTFKVRVLDEKKAKFSLNPKMARQMELEGKKNVLLRFGNLCLLSEADVCESISENEAGLSKTLIDGLHLPLYPDYEIRARGNEMIFGPFMGMLLSAEDKRLGPNTLEKLKVYVGDYENLHGAVMVFALDKADAAGGLVEGYCYNPVSKKFEKGAFPFPASVYRSVGLDAEWKNRFAAILGDRLFNSRYFSKWQTYRWFGNIPEFSSHMPSTSLCKAPEDILDMLSKYQTAYIKPIFGFGGHGITQAKIEDGKYVFRYREKGVNFRDEMKSEEEVQDYITRKFSGSKYLVQQPIDLLKVKGHVMDFRCVMQKNGRGVWTCMAIIGRLSERGSVVSNISSGGKAFSLNGIGRNLIPLPDGKVKTLGAEMSDFAKKICDALDSFGINCGMLGLDVGVDKDGKFWLIEINNRDPDPTIALDVSDKALYTRLKTGILGYAKYLCGF